MCHWISVAFYLNIDGFCLVEKELNRLVNRPFEKSTVSDDRSSGAHEGDDRLLDSFAKLFRGRSDKDDTDGLPEMVFV